MRKHANFWRTLCKLSSGDAVRAVKSALFGVCAFVGVFVCPWRFSFVVARFNGFVARASCFRCCAFPLGMLSRSKFSPLLAFGGVGGVFIW